MDFSLPDCWMQMDDNKLHFPNNGGDPSIQSQAAFSPMAVSSAPSVPRAAMGMAGRFFFGSLCAGTFGLGTWQTLRYRDKVALVGLRAQDLQEEPLVYGSATVAAGNDTSSKDAKINFRRLQFTGRFQHDREFLVGPRGPPKGALPQGPGSSSGGLSSAPQGFLVVTPMILTENGDVNNGAVATILVNRGWVPMQQVNSSRYGRSQSQQRYKQLRSRGEQSTDSSSDTQKTSMLQWDRPSGDVTITVVPGTFEEPKFLIAEHNLAETPPKLYWFDMPTMLKLGGMEPKETDDEIGNHQHPVLAIQVQDNQTEAPISNSRQWPVRPTAEAASEFKISPFVHAGYAFTWYSLSAAGVFMTRELLQRAGRR